MAPVVKALMFLTFPISWPLSKILDAVLGTEHGTFYRRTELSVLVDLHQQDDEENEDPLSRDEALIITGALSMREKRAQQAFTPLDKVYSIDINGCMDERTMEEILNTGHSRIPIYEANKLNLLGLLLVKRLIKLDPADCIPIHTIFQKEGRELPKVLETIQLYDLLNQFQDGRSHMCCVTAATGNIGEIIGIITLEDVIEELIQEEILDETDLDVMRRIAIAKAQVARRIRNRSAAPDDGGRSGLRGSSRQRPAVTDADDEEDNDVIDDTQPLIQTI